jgi:glycosyltransferase involved in cell wall biosynthesis
MAVYNTPPEFLRPAIDSILAQSFSDFEFLIINDASTHGDVENTILSYADKRIVYMRNEQNLGIAGARNRLFGAAQGEYLAVMDSDDISLAGRLAKQVAFLDANPEVGLCGTAYRRFGRLLKNGVVRHPQHHEQIKAALFFKCAVHHSSAVMRADIIRKHNIRYDESLTSSNDRKLYMDMSKHAELHNLSEVLCLYRVHAGGISRKHRKAVLEDKRKLAADFMSRMGSLLPPEQENALHNYIMRRRIKPMNAQALEYAERALDMLEATNRISRFLPPDDFARLCARYRAKCRARNVLNVWNRAA